MSGGPPGRESRHSEAAELFLQLPPGPGLVREDTSGRGPRVSQVASLEAGPGSRESGERGQSLEAELQPLCGLDKSLLKF